MSNIIDYLPEFYKGIKEFEELAMIEDGKFSTLQLDMEGLLDDQFIMTSGEAAITRREKMLMIRADRSFEDLEFRRLRLINRISSKPPFTVRYLNQQLDILSGAGNYQVNVDPENYFIEVIFEIRNQSIPQEVLNMLDRILPLNLDYDVGEVLVREVAFKSEPTAQLYDFQYYAGQTVASDTVEPNLASLVEGLINYAGVSSKAHQEFLWTGQTIVPDLKSLSSSASLPSVLNHSSNVSLALKTYNVCGVHATGEVTI